MLLRSCAHVVIYIYTVDTFGIHGVSMSNLLTIVSPSLSLSTGSGYKYISVHAYLHTAMVSRANYSPATHTRFYSRLPAMHRYILLHPSSLSPIQSTQLVPPAPRHQFFPHESSFLRHHKGPSGPWPVLLPRAFGTFEPVLLHVLHPRVHTYFVEKPSESCVRPNFD